MSYMKQPYVCSQRRPNMHTRADIQVRIGVDLNDMTVNDLSKLAFQSTYVPGTGNSRCSKSAFELMDY